jgi:hypothetical protein
MSKEFALSEREDVSRFMVHLTRDDRQDYDHGGSARSNLLSILSEKRVRALSPHCTFNRQIKALSGKNAVMFHTTCFTETPLNRIHLLVRDILGRGVKLAPYGICFTKDFIVQQRGQPTIYINEYNNNTWLRECVDELFEKSVTPTKVIKPHWRTLPFVNSMHDGYDFLWEREWR